MNWRTTKVIEKTWLNIDNPTDTSSGEWFSWRCSRWKEKAHAEMAHEVDVEDILCFSSWGKVSQISDLSRESCDMRKKTATKSWGVYFADKRGKGSRINGFMDAVNEEGVARKVPRASRKWDIIGVSRESCSEWLLDDYCARLRRVEWRVWRLWGIWQRTKGQSPRGGKWKKKTPKPKEQNSMPGLDLMKSWLDCILGRSDASQNSLACREICDMRRKRKRLGILFTAKGREKRNRRLYRCRNKEEVREKP